MRYFLYLLLLSTYHFAISQQELIIDLEETIGIAQGEAPVALIARTRFTNNYWRYQSFLADFRPQLSLNSTLPDLNRGIDLITLPDGSDAFVGRSLMTSTVGIQLGQIIPQTGGFIFAGTSLRRIDLFKTDLNPKRLSYLSVPLSIGFNQPLFQHNPFRWEKQIEALQYEEARQIYVEEHEQIAFDAVNLFFSLYISQLNLEEAEREKLYADSLYEISQGRFEVGRIAETDLLQIELRARNAETNLATELLNYQTANEELRNYLGFRESINFNLSDPEALPDYPIDIDLALEHAKANRSQTTEFRRRMLEAEMQLDDANRSTGFRVDLRGSFGLSQTGKTIGDAYQSLLDEERLSLSLQVPIADWGKARSRKEIARSNMDLTRRNIDQDNINFEREIILKVQQMELKRRQLDLAGRAFEVAEKRREIAKNRYQIGKIDVTDLNIALNEYDVSRRSYFQALWDLWTAHYEIRNLTLYDFREGRPLQRNLDEPILR